MGNVTDAGLHFIGELEGFRSQAYRDVGGVWTIGFGFTMLDATFASYWQQTRGHSLKAGDTLTRDEADKLFRPIVDGTYAAAVARKLPSLTAPQNDASTSVAFNAGAGTLSDRWAQALAAGDVHGAATLLASTRITANGKFAQGLVNRRIKEARLLEFGDYDVGADAAVSIDPGDVASYQTDLIALGYDLGTGAADGIAGMATIAAVKEFQAEKGLVVDGKVGPATRAALDRAMQGRTATKVIGTATGIAVAVGAGGDLGNTTSDPAAQVDISAVSHAIGWGIGVAIVVLVIGGVAFLLYRNRLAIKARLKGA